MCDYGHKNYQKLTCCNCKCNNQRKGNFSYMNYFNKVKNLETNTEDYHQFDSKQCSCETVVMQEIANSSSIHANHVYPTNNILPMCAFQDVSCSNHNILQKSTILQKEMASPYHRMNLSSAPGTGNLSRRSTIQETSFMNKLNNDAVVQKIHNMFPTAGEDHIRLLLKKYYNSEAVVISALQVEKYPVTMPGPFVTPPAQRHLFPNDSFKHMTSIFGQNNNLRSQNSLVVCDSYSRTSSPLLQSYYPLDSLKIAACKNVKVDSTIIPGYCRTPCHHYSHSKSSSSPKMKLRYLKTIFPKMDETLLLDVLANSENNVQKATDTLTSQGFMKHVLLAAPVTISQSQNNHQLITTLTKSDNQRHEPTKTVSMHPREYTEDEKISIKCSTKQKYPLISDDIILMALETVNYSEERVSQILQVVLQEEQHRNSENLNCNSHLSKNADDNDTFTYTDLRKNNKNGITEKQSTDYPAEETRKESKLSVRLTQARGPNKNLAKGPNERLLLADYVTWNGANPELLQVHEKIHIGPNVKLLAKRNYQPCGHNMKLCKGHQVNLDKGSIYTQHSS